MECVTAAELPSIPPGPALPTPTSVPPAAAAPAPLIPTLPPLPTAPLATAPPAPITPAPTRASSRARGPRFEEVLAAAAALEEETVEEVRAAAASRAQREPEEVEEEMAVHRKQRSTYTLAQRQANLQHMPSASGPVSHDRRRRTVHQLIVGRLALTNIPTTTLVSATTSFLVPAKADQRDLLFLYDIASQNITVSDADLVSALNLRECTKEDLPPTMTVATTLSNHNHSTKLGTCHHSILHTICVFQRFRHHNSSTDSTGIRTQRSISTCAAKWSYGFLTPQIVASDIARYYIRSWPVPAENLWKIAFEWSAEDNEPPHAWTRLDLLPMAPAPASSCASGSASVPAPSSGSSSGPDSGAAASSSSVVPASISSSGLPICDTLGSSVVTSLQHMLSASGPVSHDRLRRNVEQTFAKAFKRLAPDTYAAGKAYEFVDGRLPGFAPPETREDRERALIALFRRKYLLNRQPGGFYSSYQPSGSGHSLLTNLNTSRFTNLNIQPAASPNKSIKHKASTYERV
ncbi:uncharacterized protein EV422DRAFT_572175 [Fimicolochytrium jonesii]|uniref:uncharacterized protein n=1 Tax=Fimicolochytrium jonesii TaxID=1396493 RepID=UPI0022FDF536|nr:uncharacterized protein EV422DRAFT_572175 [Fimicolochytrium jonesii]KAI8816111.1 hypothetical protein EV422DRAFT_572175 [Fimicolochytrium jonesii]